MIPVYQHSFGYGKGSCAWACVASIFEVSIESLKIDKIMPPTDTDLAKFTACRWPAIQFHYEDLACDYELIDGPSVPEHPHPKRWSYAAPETFEPPPVEFWMATVFSPGLKRPVGDPYYPMPALHAVVMQGDKLAHDPNPNYTHSELYSPVVAKSWWTS